MQHTCSSGTKFGQIATTLCDLVGFWMNFQLPMLVIRLDYGIMDVSAKQPVHVHTATMLKVH